MMTHEEVALVATFRCGLKQFRVSEFLSDEDRPVRVKCHSRTAVDADSSIVAQPASLQSARMESICTGCCQLSHKRRPALVGPQASAIDYARIVLDDAQGSNREADCCRNPRTETTTLSAYF